VTDPTLLFVFLLCVAIILVGITILRAIRSDERRKQAEDGVGSEASKKQHTWLEFVELYWWVLGWAAAALKFIYRQWKTAPEGSREKFGWGLLLAFIVSVGMYALLKLVDHRINRSEEWVSKYGELTSEGDTE
jgi:hypothetical protein